MNKKDFENLVKILAGVYLICVIIFIIFGSLPLVEWIHVNPEHHGGLYRGGVWGYQILIYGGWGGILLIFISIIYTFRLSLNKAIKFGIPGTILIWINLIVVISIYLDYSRNTTIYRNVVIHNFFFIILVISIIFICMNLSMFILKEKIETKEIEMGEGEKTSGETKFCSNCGEKIEKEATFCEFCSSKQ